MNKQAAPDVTRVIPGAGAKPETPPVRSSASPHAIAAWTAGMALFALVLAPIGDAIAREISLQAMILADETAMHTYRPIMPAVVPETDSFEAISEIALSEDDIGLALSSARKAVESDPDRAFVWARLAYLETEQAGKVTPAALDALGRSLSACPLCNEELIRWRFRFVLSNWDAIPEELRKRTFESADILRWTGRNADFLAEMRIKSMAAGIHYDAYRAAVDSPVHTWELDYIEAPSPARDPAQAPSPDLRQRAED